MSEWVSQWVSKVGIELLGQLKSQRWKLSRNKELVLSSPYISFSRVQVMMRTTIMMTKMKRWQAHDKNRDDINHTKLHHTHAYTVERQIYGGFLSTVAPQTKMCWKSFFAARLHSGHSQRTARSRCLWRSRWQPVQYYKVSILLNADALECNLKNPKLGIPWRPPTVEIHHNTVSSMRLYAKLFHQHPPVNNNLNSEDSYFHFAEFTRSVCMTPHSL